MSKVTSATTMHDGEREVCRGCSRPPGADHAEGCPHDSEPAEDWSLEVSPEAYLNRYPDGPNAELAREHLEGGGS